MSARLGILLALIWLGAPIPARGVEPLTLGVHPYLPATELVGRFRPIARYLGEVLGRPVELEIARDYAHHIERAGRNQLDVAFLGPAPYVKMVEEFGHHPILARLEVNGRPYFRGVLIARRHGPIRSLAQVRGRRFAFGDRLSTMSHLLPRYVLWRAGIGLTDLGSYEFLGSHNNVALGVLMGDFDAGAVKEEVYDDYRMRGLRALRRTPPIPEHLFVTRSNLPDSLVARLRAALLSLDTVPGGQRILRSIQEAATGLVPARDSDYDGLRRILEQLRRLGVEF